MTLKADSLTFDSKTGSVTATGGATLTRGEANEPARAEPQILIEARFIETDGKTGKEDVLSAPKVTTLSGQQATITVGRDIALQPADAAGKLAGVLGAMTVQTGVALNITPVLEDGLILLKGTATVREVEAGLKAADLPARDRVLVNAKEFSFSLLTHPGIAVVIGPFPRGADGRDLRLRLMARVVPSDNAAPIYWQAFAVLPDAPSDKAEAARDAWLKECEPALRLLHSAAGKKGCDWELDYSRGPELQLAHLSKARALANAAMARAGKGDTAPALADLAAVLDLSRHVGTDPLLISQLVRVALEKTALDKLVALAPSLTPGQKASVLKTLDSLRPAPTLPECIELERATFGGWLQQTLAEKGGKGVSEILALMNVGEGNKAWEKRWGKTTEGVVTRMLKDLDEDYRELGRITALGRSEREAAHAAFAKKIQDEKEQRPLSAVTLPAVASAEKKFEEADARLEAAKTALR